ncbi:MAG: TspO/MBR family protein [Gemmatimonadaceae bacterium]
MPTTLAPHTRSAAARVRRASTERPRIRPRLSRRDATSLAAFALTTAGAAGLGSYFVPARKEPRASAWLRRLRGARLRQPPTLLRPVRTALYSFVALSGWRIWRASDGDTGWPHGAPRPEQRPRMRALALWATQLGLDAAWSPLFFRRKSKTAALADVVALLGTAGAYTATARRIDRPAAWLMAPYLGLVGVATYLNAGVARRSALGT